MANKIGDTSYGKISFVIETAINLSIGIVWMYQTSATAAVSAVKEIACDLLGSNDLSVQQKLSSSETFFKDAPPSDQPQGIASAARYIPKRIQKIISSADARFGKINTRRVNEAVSNANKPQTLGSAACFVQEHLMK